MSSMLDAKIRRRLREPTHTGVDCESANGYGGLRSNEPDKLKSIADTDLVPVSYTHLTLPTIYSV